MSDFSPRMNWPFPAEGVDPWWENFLAFVRATDASGYASREDRNLILMGGGTVAWNGTTGALTWSDALEVLSPNTGFLNRAVAGTITVADGQVIRAALTRAPGENVAMALSLGSFALSNDNSLVIAIRRGTRLYFRNGLMLNSGDSVTNVGSGQGGGGGGGTTLQSAYDGGQTIVAAPGTPVNISTATADTDFPFQIGNSGTNPGVSRWAVGNRDPNGFVTGNAGDHYLCQGNGGTIRPTLYVCRGGTVWADYSSSYEMVNNGTPVTGATTIRAGQMVLCGGAGGYAINVSGYGFAERGRRTCIQKSIVGGTITVTLLGGLTFPDGTITRAITTAYGKVIIVPRGTGTTIWDVEQDDEVVESGASFSLLTVTDDQEVADGQVMLRSRDFTIKSTGNVSVKSGADTLSTEKFENHSIALVPARGRRIVHLNDAMLHTESMVVEGELVVDGELVEVPTGDTDVMEQLQAVAPGTPSLLGTAPLGFKTPAEARAILDSPSVTEMNAAIAAIVLTATALATTGSPVVISGAAPPSVGETLVATSATTAEWQSGSGLTGTTGASNTALGQGASAVATENVAIGVAALEDNATGVANTAVGFNALKDTTSQSGNTAIGSRAMLSATGTYAVAVGYQAAATITGDECVAIGLMALYMGSGDHNVAVGARALSNAVTAQLNVAVGTEASESLTDGSQTVAVGYRAVRAATTGESNVGVGGQALRQVTTGGYNTAVGSGAGLGLQTAASYNVAIGHATLFGNSTADGNTAIGQAALTGCTGANNTAVGRSAGSSLTSGSRNILVGYNVQAPNATDSDKLNIGNAITGDLATGQITFRRTTTDSITASTTQTQGNGPLTSDINRVSTVANNNDTVTLPTASPGRECIVINDGSNTLRVFPASGGNLGAGLNTATTQTTGVTARYVAYSSTNWKKL